MADSSTGLSVVSSDLAEQAGACVWWELRGGALLEDLVEALEQRGIANLAPEPPSLEQSLYRAAHAVAQKMRVVLRPIGRNVWEAFQEDVIDDEDTGKRIQHTSLAVGRVVAENGVKRAVVSARLPEVAHVFRQDVLRSLPQQSGMLTAQDISSWMLDIASRGAVQAVALRSRGGFYFVPAGPGLELWTKVTEAVQAASSTVTYRLPTLPSEEASTAVLAAVRRDADDAFRAMEDYLKGQVHTKGLNATAKHLLDAQAKIARYEGLFERDLNDLRDRAGLLDGALAAARLAHDAEQNPSE